jgi:hypothetical protein
MEKNFIRVRSIKDIIISSSLIIAGCILVSLPSSDSANIAGFFIVVAGLALAFILKTAYKDSDSGEKFAKKERFFGNEMYDRLKSVLTCPSPLDPYHEDRGSSLRLDIYYNKSKVYVQLFEYIPYKYEPCSSMHEHSFEKAGKLIG